MDHSAYGRNYIVHLDSGEILAPYTVLNELFGTDGLMDARQDDLFDLLTLGLRPGQWRRYGTPWAHYSSYISLMRLIEAGWLMDMLCRADGAATGAVKRRGAGGYRNYAWCLHRD